MNSNGHPRIPAATVLLVLAVSVFFYIFVGKTAGSTWPANAIHNWEQFGFSALHGKLITNPGGFEVLEHPKAYPGHRPASYFPVVLTGKLLGWLGDSLLIYHALFSAALFVAVWYLLGRSPLAVCGGIAAALCPGYTVYPTVVDPNAMAIYMVVPYAAVLMYFLSAKELPAWKVAVLALLTFAFTQMNWSTALGHGVLFCALVAWPSIPFRRVGLYLLLAGASIAVVGTLSVIDKFSAGASAEAGGGGKNFLLAYTWGHIGYGADLTTVKAIVRLAVVNTVGQLPLLAFAGWLAWRARNGSRGIWPAFLPLVAACIGLLTFRNYFGHHPWMSAPLLLPGLVFTLALLVQRMEPGELVPAKKLAAVAFLLCAFGYAAAVLGVHRVYHSDALQLISFVRSHTARTDTVCLVQSLDPDMAGQTESLSEACDRHMILLPDLSALPAEGKVFVLTGTNVGGAFSAVAKSEPALLASQPWFQNLSGWYRARVSKRSAWDRHFEYAAGAGFTLYQPTR